MTSDSPVKRLIYTTQYSPWSPYSGGGQRSTHNLAMEMSRRGHEVHVIYSRTPFDRYTVPDDLPYQIHWATLYHCRSSRQAPLRPMTSLDVHRIVSSLIQNSPLPVVVHANGEEAARVGMLRNRFPFLFVVTPRYPDYPAAIGRWDNLSAWGRILLWLCEWKYLALGQALRQADLVCPPSSWAGEQIETLYGLNRERIRPVSNGVPKEFLYIERSAEASAGPIFFFGRLSYDKGVDLLLRAYRELPAPRPALHIAGAGEEENRLRTMILELKLQESVLFLPWQTHSQLAERLSKARMAVLPSRNENYSLAVLSAMASGTPTLSTRVGGTVEQIRDKKDGILVDGEQARQLTEAMSWAIQHPEKAEEMGRKAARRMAETHTWQATCNTLENLYNHSLSDISVRFGS